MPRFVTEQSRPELVELLAGGPIALLRRASAMTGTARSHRPGESFELLASFVRRREQPRGNGRSDVRHWFAHHADCASRYGRMTLSIRNARAIVIKASTVTFLRRKPSRSASSPTSSPMRFR